MKKVWAVILALLLLACATPQAAAEEGILRESVDNTRPKIISVIFDDSTSMIQDDEGERKFTTRWVDADYAVKAMASMMDEDDTLRLYIMGDYQSEEDVRSSTKGPTTVTFGNKKDAIDAIETRMSDLQSQEGTFSLAMDAAKNDFTRSERLDKECWIVILTDGRFTNPEHLDGTMLKEKLVNLTQVSAGSLHVAYVPIGNGAIQLEEDAANHIIVPEEKQDVTKQVTEIINRIYGRVRMDDAISRQYLITEEDRIVIRPNVPMEKVVVFLQYQGPEEYYTAYAGRLAEGAEATDNLLTPPLEPSAPSYLHRKETSYFGGKQKAPKSSKKIESVRYHVLQGAVFTWESNSAVADVNFADQEIVIPITEGMNIQKEVYYQPAVRVGFDYLLDGVAVEHTPECGFTGTPIEEENCIQEGTLDVRLKMLDTKGDELQEPFSPFLYPDKFIVELYPEDKSERVVLQGGGLTYQYQGTVEQKKYMMQIQTPWNEVLNQAIDVLEKRKPLEIIPISSEIVVDDASGERRLLTVQVNEGGEPISAANAGYVDINCVCDDEGLLVERQAAQLDGRWSFLVTLKDPSEHQIAKTALFHLTAVRNYSEGGPTEWTRDVELSLTSDPHTLEIQYEEETVIGAAGNLLTSQPMQMILNIRKADIAVTYRTVYAEERRAMVQEPCYQLVDERAKREFGKYFRQARYLDEQGNKRYISRLFLSGHLEQKYQPGQFVVLDGKYYEVSGFFENEYERLLEVKRASEQIFSRRYYRQRRYYRIRNSVLGGEASKIVFHRNTMQIQRCTVDISGYTYGYQELREWNNIAEGRFVLNPNASEECRQYQGKQLLRVESLENDPQHMVSCLWLAVLLNEAFCTLYPQYYHLLSVGINRSLYKDLMERSGMDRGAFRTILANVQGMNAENCFYILEDSREDMGLLRSLERNFQRIVNILQNYIQWSEEHGDKYLRFGSDARSRLAEEFSDPL